MLIVQPLGSMITSLLADQEISASIADSAVIFFSTGELLRGVCRLDVSVFVSFVHILSCVVFGEGSFNLLTTGRGGPPAVSVFL